MVPNTVGDHAFQSDLVGYASNWQEAAGSLSECIAYTLMDQIAPYVSHLAARADAGPLESLHDDTFFTCARGSLKLHALSAKAGQRIFSQRPPPPGPQASCSSMAPTSSPDTLREVLARAYGHAGRGRKHRTLSRVGRTRVHLERVEGLGHFLELAVVLSEGEPATRGMAEVHALMAALGIAPTQLIAGAYVDLLAQHHAALW